jgi:hypothetical protein
MTALTPGFIVRVPAVLLPVLLAVPDGTKPVEHRS